MLGKLLAAPVRLINAPARALELLASPDEERTVSAPLEALAAAIEEAIEGEPDQ